MRRGYVMIFIFQLVRMVDRGKHVGISIADVHRHIKSGDVPSWLRSVMPEWFSDNNDPDQDSLLSDALSRTHNAYSGDEKSKWWIENSGVCILIDWMVEILAHETQDDQV